MWAGPPPPWKTDVSINGRYRDVDGDVPIAMIKGRGKNKGSSNNISLDRHTSSSTDAHGDSCADASSVLDAAGNASIDGCLDLGGGLIEGSRATAESGLCINQGMSSLGPNFDVQSPDTAVAGDLEDNVLMHNAGTLFGGTGMKQLVEAPRLHVYAKNLQSLQTQSRFDQLVLELDLLENWDLLMLNETWRETNEEAFEFDGGHMFFGSGGTKGHAGVGFMLHTRWKSCLKQFKPINTRIAFLDLDICCQRLRCVCVYMPHSDYADACV